LAFPQHVKPGFFSLGCRIDNPQEGIPRIGQESKINFYAGVLN